MSGYCLACKQELTARIKTNYTTLLCKKCGMYIIYNDGGVFTITKEEYLKKKQHKEVI
jgi:DNA-directed RNA polymerase subunit RPC12/RpoP